MVNFPTSLDSFTNPTATDATNSVTVPHATQHANLNDAVEALEAKVGVDGSAVTSSLDYRVEALESAGGTDLSYTAATRVLASSTGTDATLPLVTTSDAGLAPASGGGTSNFLRADGTWAAPSATDATKLPLSGGTMTGDITLGENAAISQDPSLSADGKYTGETVTGTAGATLAFGDLVYLDPTDSRWEKTDANSAAAADGDSRGILGICVLAAANDGDATKILLRGMVRADAKFPTFTINNPVYVSETAGEVTGTQPTTADVVIRVVGFGYTADSMYFCPSSDYITHT